MICLTEITRKFVDASAKGKNEECGDGEREREKEKVDVVHLDDYYCN
jgi:hypothetical protein